MTVPLDAVVRSMLIEGTTTTDSSSKFFWIESHASPIDSCKFVEGAVALFFIQLTQCSARGL